MAQVGRHGIGCEDQPEPAEGNEVASVAVGVVAEVALQLYLLPKGKYPFSRFKRITLKLHEKVRL